MNDFPADNSPQPPAPPVVPPVIPPPVRAIPAARPLSSEQLEAVSLAHQRARKLRTAAKVAMFNGIWLWVFSGVSLLIVAVEALFREFDAVGIIMCVGLGAIAWNEFRGRRLLLQYQPKSMAVLSWNQLALLALIVGYGAWMLFSTLSAGNPFEETMQSMPEARKMLEGTGRLYELLTIALYGGLIIGSVICQGLNSIYYFNRAKLLHAYLAETPDWIVVLQRQQAGAR